MKMMFGRSGAATAAENGTSRTNRTDATNETKRIGQFPACRSENIPAEVFILGDCCQLLLDVLRGDSNLSHLHVRSFEAQVLEQAFEDRVQPPGTDILRRLIDPEGELRQGFDRVLAELQLDTFGLEERRV